MCGGHRGRHRMSGEVIKGFTEKASPKLAKNEQALGKVTEEKCSGIFSYMAEVPEKRVNKHHLQE